MSLGRLGADKSSRYPSNSVEISKYLTGWLNNAVYFSRMNQP